MARLIDWIKEHPFYAALAGLGLGWAVKVSLKEYVPERMEPRYYGTQPEGMKARAFEKKADRRPAARIKPGELTGEFKDVP